MNQYKATAEPRRAVELLDALHLCDKPMSIKALAARLGWTRSMVDAALDLLLRAHAVEYSIGMSGKQYCRYFEPMFVGPPEPLPPKPAKQPRVKRDRKAWVQKIRDQFARPEQHPTDPWGRQVKGSQDAE